MQGRLVSRRIIGLADLGDVGRQSVTRDAVDIALAKLAFDLLLY